MALVYGDLHIHLGRTSQGQPVKITASSQLILENIWKVAKNQKGLQLIGLIDAACMGVLEDLENLHRQGALQLLSGGGYMWNGLALFLGSEVEIAHGQTGKEAHFLAYFPSIETLSAYASSIRPWLTNPNLSTQRLKMDGDTWLQIVADHGGMALAAHAFTPHKGVYGNCVSMMGEMFQDPKQIKGLELGLSANAAMALQIRDTHQYGYISNSDAHSLNSIGREFTLYDLPSLNFTEWSKALDPKSKGIVTNHGLEPLLGKYYRSYCLHCERLAQDEVPMSTCSSCGQGMILGVWDRIQMIGDFQGEPPQRAHYHAHVPLLMLPGVGLKTYERMIRELGTEIDILYNLSLEAIRDMAGAVITKQIEGARRGILPIRPGGGGKYGRVTKVD